MITKKSTHDVFFNTIYEQINSLLNQEHCVDAVEGIVASMFYYELGNF